MRKSIATLIGIATAMSCSFAQIYGSIRGNVLDLTTEEPLTGAKVMTVDSVKTNGDFSDSLGAFEITSLNPGRYTLRVSFLGYEVEELENIEVVTGKETVLNLRLTSSISQLSSVVVKARRNESGSVNKMASVSNRTITLEETKRYAGTAGDPSRLVAGFAGVNAVDGDNDLIIRGNSPVGMIWQMEGIEIPNPNHFSSQGSSGGRISMLNSNVLSNSTFYTGAFPADYGNGYSGVFDVQLREGNDRKGEQAFKIGALGTDLSTEGPVFNKLQGSYLVNYRYSTLAILNKIGVNIAGNVVPDYQDLTYNLKFKNARFGKLNLFGLLGTGTAENNWQIGQDQFKDSYRSELLVSGIKYRKSIGSKTFLQCVGAFTGTRRLYSRFLTESNTNPVLTYSEKFLDPTARARINLTHRFNPKHQIRLGGIYNYIEFDHLSMQSNKDDEMGIDQNGNGNTLRYQGHFQWRNRVNSAFDFKLGFHYTFFVLTKEHRLEPRFGANLLLDDQSSLSFGYGRHSKSWDLAIYNVAITDESGNQSKPNQQVEMLDAHHFVVGYKRSFGKSWQLMVETYFQHLKNVPVGSDSNSYTSLINLKNYFPTEVLVNEGSGHNFGTEFTVERSFRYHWYMNLTASLFDSKYRTRSGKQYNTRWNSNYIFNIQGGKEFVLANPVHSISISTRFIWSGGNRYTPIDIPQSIELATQVYQLEAAYSSQFPDYIRLDLKLSYRLNSKRMTHSIMIDIQNATNRTNFASQYFDTSSFKVIRVHHLGIVPVFSYKILF